MRVMRRFGTDRAGSTAILFGLTLLPLMGAVGAAVDYSRAASFHSRAQLAVDGAALAIVREPDTLTPAEIQAKGETYVRDTIGHMLDPARGATLGTVTTTREGRVVKVALAATMKPSIMQVLGVNAMPVTANAQATWGSRLELALVLDNTGSMDDTIGGKKKIDELKTASANLLKQLKLRADTPDRVKVSLVPFASQVRLDPARYRNETWFRWNDPIRDPARWTGYVNDRAETYVVSDVAPSLAVDSTRYPAAMKADYGQIAMMRPLTSLADPASYDAMLASVASMRAEGSTNVPIGMSWGFATLTSGIPFTEAAPKDTAGVHKVMIVMTDGDNTSFRVDGVVRGFAEGTGYPIDARTRATCDLVKRDNVTVYTIRMLAGNVDLLRSCATTPDNYFDVSKAGDLDLAFKKILASISATTLTH